MELWSDLLMSKNEHGYDFTLYPELKESELWRPGYQCFKDNVGNVLRQGMAIWDQSWFEDKKFFSESWIVFI